jgi:nucleoside triphosphate pyrophosphatase
MLYLASQSPRRHELLRQLGVAFEVVGVDVPETRRAAESPRAYVARVARTKADAGLAALAPRDPAAVVLGADTEVVLGDRVFGKPVNADEAAGMLRALSGRSHSVLTAVWVVAVDRAKGALNESEVRFTAIDDSAIEGYVATGEPFGKAGGYAIQGRAAAFIERLSGSYSGVVGLPLFETAELLRGFGAMGRPECDAD